MTNVVRVSLTIVELSSNQNHKCLTFYLILVSQTLGRASSQAQNVPPNIIAIRFALL